MLLTFILSGKFVLSHCSRYFFLWILFPGTGPEVKTLPLKPFSHYSPSPPQSTTKLHEVACLAIDSTSLLMLTATTQRSLEENIVNFTLWVLIQQTPPMLHLLPLWTPQIWTRHAGGGHECYKLVSATCFIRITSASAHLDKINIELNLQWEF